MGLVRAKKLISWNIENPGSTIMVVVVVIDIVVVASEVSQVGNNWKLPVRVLIDGGEPVEVAVAGDRVPV